MALPRPFNRNGVYGLESVGTPVVTTTNVTFQFEDHPYVNFPYNGLVIIKINTAIPEGTTTTLPIYFQTGNNNPVAVTKVGNVPLTVADIGGTGYYLFFYDYRAGVVQAIASLA